MVVPGIATLSGHIFEVPTMMLGRSKPVWWVWRCGLLGVMLALVSNLAVAEVKTAVDQPQGVRLTELLQKAVTQHPSIFQARSQLKAQGFELDAPNWGRFPSLTSEVRSDSRFAQSIAKLEQPIWAGGRIDGRIELGQANVRVGQAALQEAELNAMSQVGGSFFEMLRLAARLRTADDNVKEHQRLVDMISRRVQAQISPEADTTLAMARLQQARSEQLQMSRQLESTRNQLSQWVGPVVGLPTEPQKIDYRAVADPQEVAERALEYSAQRQKLVAQMEAASAQIALARSQTMPTVVAGYQYVLSGPLFTSPDRGRAYMGLQFQSGAGLSALAGIQSAVSRQEAAEQEMKVLELSLRSQVLTLHNDIENLQTQLPPAQALEAATVELMASVLRQYQIGKKNWLDVLNAQRERTQAGFNLADVRFSLLQSQLRLLILTGAIRAQNTSLIHE